MSRPEAQLLFVYGSLKRGLPNHRLLGDAEFVGESLTVARYELVMLGAYPALVAGGTRAIVGELYAVDSGLLARLDAFEGDEYQRGPVELMDGRAVEAYGLACGLLDPVVLWPLDSWP
jgi:gamma-glutamylaminecyclotransferase